jgi:(S)-ureidoglycine aminohydrolase
MPELFGSTRTTLKGRYALLAPDSFVPSYLPGWKSASVVVNISPAMGARFTQLLITLDKDGTGEGNTGANQYFIYFVEGAGSILVGDRRHRLDAGNYVYLPPGTDMQIKSSGVTTRLLVFQKRYEGGQSSEKPAAIIGHERDVKGQPFQGNEDARLQVLLPDNPAFDMAVNIFTYQPGATLPNVESHIMEHGLLMLRGQGIYRLDADWHPVQAGDAIWMSPYCPQWFVAMGKTPASYIYYKDVNRDPM